MMVASCPALTAAARLLYSATSSSPAEPISVSYRRKSPYRPYAPANCNYMLDRLAISAALFNLAQLRFACREKIRAPESLRI